MIDNLASFIHAEHLFMLEVVVIGDRLTYFETTLLQSSTHRNCNVRKTIVSVLTIAVSGLDIFLSNIS